MTSDNIEFLLRESQSILGEAGTIAHELRDLHGSLQNFILLKSQIEQLSINDRGPINPFTYTRNQVFIPGHAIFEQQLLPLENRFRDLIRRHRNVSAALNETNMKALRCDRPYFDMRDSCLSRTFVNISSANRRCIDNQTYITQLTDVGPLRHAARSEARLAYGA